MRTRNTSQAILFTFMAVVLMASPALAQKEKGAKKCSDVIDNDNDGYIDCLSAGTPLGNLGPDSDCGCAPPPPPSGGADYNIKVYFDDVLAVPAFDQDFSDMALECGNGACSIVWEWDGASSPIMFPIPASYWERFGLSMATTCYGGTLVSPDPAYVVLTRIAMKDHHGPIEQWALGVQHLANYVDGVTELHQFFSLGDCGGACPDLGPNPITVETEYPGGHLERTAIMANGSKPKKTPSCTCKYTWNCPPDPEVLVRVTVEPVP